MHLWLLLAAVMFPVTVQVKAVRSNKGQVACALYDSAKAFPVEEAAAIDHAFCSIESGLATCRFKPVQAGTYAVACFHDEDGNGKLATMIFGMPKEGLCASNDARGTFGPPKFDDAKFEVRDSASSTISMSMKY